MKKNLLSHKNIIKNPNLVNDIGSKAAGLVKAQNIVDDLSKNFDLNVSIPEYFVVTPDAFTTNDNPQDSNIDIVSDDLLHSSMKALVKLGGNVAVRSSSNVEDVEGMTFSGEFDSVLNVKNIKDMKKALTQVYKSQYSSEKVKSTFASYHPKMSILIQKMIDKPMMSGVIYSRAFCDDISNNTDSSIMVANYVKNKTAEDLVMAKESGKIKNIRRYDLDSDEKLIELLPENLNLLRNYNKLSLEDRVLKELGCIVNKMEKEYGTAIDMEFAVTKDKHQNAHIHILQQRPYVADSNFHIASYENGNIYGYPKDKGGIIEGEVVTIDDEICDFDDVKLPDFKDKILLLRLSKKEHDFEDDDEYQMYIASGFYKIQTIVGNYRKNHYKDANLVIDTTGYLQCALYGHIGNELRENAQAFIIADEESFSKLKKDDYIKVDLDAGKYKLSKEKSGGKLNKFLATCKKCLTR